MKRLSRRRPEEKVVDFQVKVDQLVRLDRAEDRLLAQAAREAHEAEVHAVRALEAIAAAKRPVGSPVATATTCTSYHLKVWK